MTSVNISLCLLLTYFMCNHGDDDTKASSDDVARQQSSWLQPVIKFVDKLLHSNRRYRQYLQQTLTLINSLLTINIDIGSYFTECPYFLVIFVQFCSQFAGIFGIVCKAAEPIFNFVRFNCLFCFYVFALMVMVGNVNSFILKTGL